MKQIHEIFNDFNAAKNIEQRRQVLLQNNTPILRNVLQGAFHPAIQFVVDRPVPYKTTNIDDFGYTSLNEAMDKVYIFTVGSKKVSPNLTKENKIKVLIQVLEALDKEEANVYMNMLLKDLKVKHLTFKLVDETFPGLLS